MQRESPSGGNQRVKPGSTASLKKARPDVRKITRLVPPGGNLVQGQSELAINPDLASAHNGLGVALAAQGQIERATAEWTRALALRPGYADAQYNLDRARK